MASAAPQPATLLATGFVCDQPAEGTHFPSAGGNSAEIWVQAVYWRCLVVFFASARIANPDQRLVLFTNARPPVVDGHDLTQVLARYGVELRLVPLSVRLKRELTPSWGNVLYFFDVMSALEGEPDDTRIALMDSDVVVTGAVQGLFDLLDGADYALYPQDSDADENINGLSRRQMGAIAGALGGGSDPGPIAHYGGELFLTSMGRWRRDEAVFRALLDNAIAEIGPGAAVRTEEHVFSIASQLTAAPVADAGGKIKRIWTSWDYNNAAPGDEALPLWHMPAEKRYGLRDMFGWLAANDFPHHMAPEAFRKLAMARCGVPRKTWAKQLRDGVRRVAGKLGMRR